MGGSLLDIPGIKVGTVTSKEAVTGCTVVLVEEGAVAGVDVRGSAPGTRETDLLRPMRTVEKIQGVLLSGGSAFGLDAAAGVMRYLAEREKGFRAGSLTIPLVPGAVIFDLFIGDASLRPDQEMGYRACLHASDSVDALEGSVGAGTGATAGKVLGPLNATKSGQGTASRQVNELIVAALVVVNAFGDVYDREGVQIAGPRDPDSGCLLSTTQIITGGDWPEKEPFNTTLALVATNAGLSKEGVSKVAQMAHDGLARSIRPVHTLWDGDTVFSLSLGQKEADWDLVGILAADVVSEAIERAVVKAESLGGIPSYARLKNSARYNPREGKE